MADAKTNGQLLYEHLHPPTIRVVRWADRHFAREPFDVPNPAESTPWHFIAQTDKDRYERQAVGHFLFSKVEA